MSEWQGPFSITSSDSGTVPLNAFLTRCYTKYAVIVGLVSLAIVGINSQAARSPTEAFLAVVALAFQPVPMLVVAWAARYGQAWGKRLAVGLPLLLACCCFLGIYSGGRIPASKLSGVLLLFRYMCVVQLFNLPGAIIFARLASRTWEYPPSIHAV